MNHFYYFCKTLNIARSQGSLPETPHNSLRTLARLSLDLLFFRDTASTTSTFKSFVGKSIINFYVTHIPSFFFYEEVEHIDLAAYYSNLYRPFDPKPLSHYFYSESKFNEVKENYAFFLIDGLNDLFEPFNLLSDTDHEFIGFLLFRDIFGELVANAFFFTNYNLDFKLKLSKFELLVLAFNTYLLGKKYNDYLVHSINPYNSIEVGRALLITGYNYASLDGYDDKELLALNKYGDELFKKSKKKPISFENALSNIESKTIYTRPVYVYTSKYRKLLEKIIITPADTKKYILCSAIKPISNDNLVYVSFVTNQCGAKSYTMRSRQFYRSGVLFCLALTLITIITPYYLFYGLTFLFSY